MQRLSSIEIDPRTLTVTLYTKEGYPIASNTYSTKAEMNAGVRRLNAQLLKNHPKTAQIIKPS